MSLEPAKVAAKQHDTNAAVRKGGGRSASDVSCGTCDKNGLLRRQLATSLWLGAAGSEANPCPTIPKCHFKELFVVSQWGVAVSCFVNPLVIDYTPVAVHRSSGVEAHGVLSSVTVHAPQAPNESPAPRRNQNMRKASWIAALVVGALLIVGGAATWWVVSDTLAAQQITVSDDADCLAGDEVNGPFSAYCEAKVIEKHALEATGGLYYAEMDRDDPLRAVAASAAYLQASLFTSVVAFGVAGMAILMGIVFILIGLGIRDVDARTSDSVAT